MRVEQETLFVGTAFTFPVPVTSNDLEKLQSSQVTGQEYDYGGPEDMHRVAKITQVIPSNSQNLASEYGAKW